MEEVKQKSWFSRNWGWLLGGGCLSIIVVVILLIVGAFYKITNSIKDSEPYSHAFSKAIENEKVIYFLGEPIETNGIGTSNFKFNNGQGEARLIIPIKGPKGEGSITVDAENSTDYWIYNELSVVIAGEEGKINLDELEIE
ncbi:cytochrome c oxidase assembly factor Coa1 family protein [Lacinutrix jangbogonensis]|uniref:cytochrome c oxidase assembly factor Coa1 family protein n=1 Tax=Lacinutrix jangbogonensis TaxID=1469557 RepID=UPI00053E0650|nr:cytochrome c oxidase assembly factor Coa1 family protein [Lacinutrix jangbogonensis]